MKLTDLFIKRPVLAIVVNLVILIAGIQSIRSLSVRQYPRSDIAVIQGLISRRGQATPRRTAASIPSSQTFGMPVPSPKNSMSIFPTMRRCSVGGARGIV